MVLILYLTVETDEMNVFVVVMDGFAWNDDASFWTF